MDVSVSIEELIKLYEKQTLDVNTDPLPESVNPITQRLGLGNEVLVMSETLADSLRESSMKLAPTVGAYDYRTVVSANEEQLNSMDFETVWKQERNPQFTPVKFLEVAIRNKSIAKWHLILMFKDNNAYTPEEQERLLKMVDEVSEKAI